MQFTVWAEPVAPAFFTPPNLSIRVEQLTANASPNERLLWAALAAHLLKAVESVAAFALDRVRGVRVTIQAERRRDFPVSMHTIYGIDIYTEASLACHEIDASADEFWAMHNDISPAYTMSGRTRCYCPTTTHPVDRCEMTFQ